MIWLWSRVIVSPIRCSKIAFRLRNSSDIPRRVAAVGIVCGIAFLRRNN
jgi:hypothetical protein